jgi:adenylate cyclase class 2
MIPPAVAIECAVMAREVEVKYRVEDFTGVRRALRSAGAEYQATVLQTDTYLDTPQRRLLRDDNGLRLRQRRYIRRAAGKRDDRPELTFKGPAHPAGRVKSRREVQTRLDCPDAIFAILRGCGFEPTLVIQKRRATYRLGPCLVELDELPMIGRFVEIECPHERAVGRIAARLKLPGEPIVDHYVNLLRERCGRVGKRCREVTFETCTPACGHR